MRLQNRLIVPRSRATGRPLPVPLMRRALPIAPPSSGRPLALFLDFDGTLAPIAENPGEARLPESTRRILARLARHPLCRLAIVSGRQISDLRAKLSVPGVALAGNHGYEIQLPGREGVVTRAFVHPAGRAARPLIAHVSHALRPQLEDLPGVLLEDKRFTISLHTRRATAADQRAAHLLLREAVRPWLHSRLLKIKRGKKVLEVRPNYRWNKGEAVRWILNKRGDEGPVVYAGDDNTDEDAFRSLRTRGVTVRVGSGPSGARYTVPDPIFLRDTLRALERRLDEVFRQEEEKRARRGATPGPRSRRTRGKTEDPPRAWRERSAPPAE